MRSREIALKIILIVLFVGVLLNAVIKGKLPFAEFAVILVMVLFIIGVFIFVAKLQKNMLVPNSHGEIFKTSIKVSGDVESILQSWLVKSGYEKVAENINGERIFRRKKYPVYPVFVSVSIEGETMHVGGWVQTGTASIPLDGNFHWIGSVRIGNKDIKSLLASVY
ncbi:hypothetical protein [Bdellovibrio sp. HCB-162]|uniref:hypothetical protein n=1 Tax=Bdellovibrio sp. HCB-162 TaxID=3394234 RepID=UPI0039BC72AB